MKKLISILKLEFMKGSRTKLVIFAFIVLTGSVETGYLDPETFETIMKFLTPVGAWFGIEHFEKKG